MGRRKGSRNRGYFYRSGRGWMATVHGQHRALGYENGDRMRDKATPVAELRAAYHRLTAKPDDEPGDEASDDATVNVSHSLELLATQDYVAAQRANYRHSRTTRDRTSMLKENWAAPT